MPGLNDLCCSEYQVHPQLKQQQQKKYSKIGFHSAAGLDKNLNMQRSQAVHSAEAVRPFLIHHYVSRFHILSQGAIFQKQLLLFQIDHSWLYLSTFSHTNGSLFRLFLKYAASFHFLLEIFPLTKLQLSQSRLFLRYVSSQ